jgi:hypothetical protein
MCCLFSTSSCELQLRARFCPRYSLPQCAFVLTQCAPSCFLPHSSHQRTLLLSPATPQLDCFCPQSSHMSRVRRASVCFLPHSLHQRHFLLSPGNPKVDRLSPQSSHMLCVRRASVCFLPHSLHQRHFLLSPGNPKVDRLSPQSSHMLCVRGRASVCFLPHSLHTSDTACCHPVYPNFVVSARSPHTCRACVAPPRASCRTDCTSELFCCRLVAHPNLVAAARSPHTFGVASCTRLR